MAFVPIPTYVEIGMESEANPTAIEGKVNLPRHEEENASRSPAPDDATSKFGFAADYARLKVGRLRVQCGTDLALVITFGLYNTTESLP
ncbi:hypothetical protein M8J77_002505 [Diaphorina citri]|nr:hypothetical protein M8J77_002505 [Diaphorina citri]